MADDKKIITIHTVDQQSEIPEEVIEEESLPSHRKLDEDSINQRLDISSTLNTKDPLRYEEISESRPSALRESSAFPANPS